MVLRVTGHPVVPFRMIYNKIVSNKHIHYPQLLGTFYKFSEIISYFLENNNANFIPKFVKNYAMR